MRNINNMLYSEETPMKDRGIIAVSHLIVHQAMGGKSYRGFAKVEGDPVRGDFWIWIEGDNVTHLRNPERKTVNAKTVCSFGNDYPIIMEEDMFYLRKGGK